MNIEWNGENIDRFPWEPEDVAAHMVDVWRRVENIGRVHTQFVLHYPSFYVVASVSDKPQVPDDVVALLRYNVLPVYYQENGVKLATIFTP